MTDWANRIVGYAEISPNVLMENPLNWKIHPDAQGDALLGVLHEIGLIQNIIVNAETAGFELADSDEEGEDIIDFIRTDGPSPMVEHVRIINPVLIDGHLRARLGIKDKQSRLPVTLVNLTPEEQSKALASLDPIGTMARLDQEKFRHLQETFAIEDSRLRSFLDTFSTTPAPTPVPTPAPRTPIRAQSIQTTPVLQKHVSLLFTTDDFALFDVAMRHLSQHYGTENRTQIILRVVEDMMLQTSQVIEQPVRPTRRGRKTHEEISSYTPEPMAEPAPEADQLPTLQVPPPPVPPSQPNAVTSSIFDDDDGGIIPELS